MENTNDSENNGSLYIDQLYTADDLGISLPEPHSDRAIQILLELGSDSGSDTQPPYTAIAPRRIEMRKGVLLLQMIEGDPASGSIYLYERETGAFFMIMFGKGDGHLSIPNFNELVDVYGLRDLAASPERIKARIQAPATA
jgi:hypothetical protein